MTWKDITKSIIEDDYHSFKGKLNSVEEIYGYRKKEFLHFVFNGIESELQSSGINRYILDLFRFTICEKNIRDNPGVFRVWCEFISKYNLLGCLKLIEKEPCFNNETYREKNLSDMAEFALKYSSQEILGYLVDNYDMNLNYLLRVAESFGNLQGAQLLLDKHNGHGLDDVLSEIIYKRLSFQQFSEAREEIINKIIKNNPEIFNYEFKLELLSRCTNSEILAFSSIIPIELNHDLLSVAFSQERETVLLEFLWESGIDKDKALEIAEEHGFNRDNLELAGKYEEFKSERLKEKIDSEISDIELNKGSKKIKIM